MIYFTLLPLNTSILSQHHSRHYHTSPSLSLLSLLQHHHHSPSQHHPHSPCQHHLLIMLTLSLLLASPYLSSHNPSQYHTNILTLIIMLTSLLLLASPYLSSQYHTNILTLIIMLTLLLLLASPSPYLSSHNSSLISSLLSSCSHHSYY